MSWEKPKPLNVTRRIDPDQRIYFISDLHLGDGSPSDAFLGKDRELIEFLDAVRDERAHLVIAGDAIDFHQAWSMSRVLKAHARLIGELARLAESHGVTYIWGNHDYDISLFKDLLRFEVCSRLELGDKVLVQHGYEYDPFIGPNLDQTHTATQVHHMIERLTGSWIRLPLENFYTPANRIAFWVSHKAAVIGGAWYGLLGRLGFEDAGKGFDLTSHYWTQNQLGDPGCLTRHVKAAMAASDFPFLVCGHSHVPGIVELHPGKTYVNTGSWTFNSSQYAVWDGSGFSVHDWMSGRTFDDRAYRRVLDGHTQDHAFMEWWRENYMGWFRFRVGEAGRLPLVVPKPPPEAVSSEEGAGSAEGELQTA